MLPVEWNVFERILLQLKVNVLITTKCCERLIPNVFAEHCGMSDGPFVRDESPKSGRHQMLGDAVASARTHQTTRKTNEL